jgi:serine/threonine-protein kinase RsbW
MKFESAPFILLTLKIESRLDVVPMAGQLVSLLCAFTGMQPSDIYLVEVCVIEAMNNSVEHAYQLDPTREVELKAEVFTDRLVFSVCDSGMSADPEVMLKKHEPVFEVDPSNLEAVPESGRGLAIIREVMDSYEYSSHAQRNRFVMTKLSCLVAKLS